MFSGRQGSQRQGRVCKHYHYWKSSCFNTSTKQHLTLHNLPFGGRSVQKVLTFVKMLSAVNKILFPGGRKFCSLLWSELLTCGNIKVFKRKVWNWSLLHAEPTQHPLRTCELWRVWRHPPPRPHSSLMKMRKMMVTPRDRHVEEMFDNDWSFHYSATKALNTLIACIVFNLPHCRYSTVVVVSFYRCELSTGSCSSSIWTSSNTAHMSASIQTSWGTGGVSLRKGARSTSLRLILLCCCWWHSCWVLCCCAVVLHSTAEYYALLQLCHKLQE